MGLSLLSGKSDKEIDDVLFNLPELEEVTERTKKLVKNIIKKHSMEFDFPRRKLLTETLKFHQTKNIGIDVKYENPDGVEPFTKVQVLIFNITGSEKKFSERIKEDKKPKLNIISFRII